MPVSCFAFRYFRGVSAQAVEELAELLAMCGPSDTPGHANLHDHSAPVRPRGGVEAPAPPDYTYAQLVAIAHHFAAVEPAEYAGQGHNGILDALGYLLDPVVPLEQAAPVGGEADQAVQPIQYTARIGSVAWYAERLHKPVCQDARMTVRQAVHMFLTLKEQGSVRDTVFDTLCAAYAAVLPEGNFFPRCDS